MHAVDTNILIRLLTHDDPKQTAVAERLFATEEIWLAKTVILETSWVLRSYYGFDGEGIHRSFLSLLGIDNVHVEDEADVVAALALAAHGVDLADALHLFSRPAGAMFVSFDQALIRRAHRAGIARVSTPSI
jgi:predicted nucleic-acid-binding protein